MAVEMCKLSLWLVSLDPKLPFSFVDDKILHGNSLLGLTDVRQLKRHAHRPQRRERDSRACSRLDVDGVLRRGQRSSAGGLPPRSTTATRSVPRTRSDVSGADYQQTHAPNSRRSPTA